MKKLGVIGGLGSKATAYFFNRLVDLTDVESDQEHIELLIHNHPQIPDRTSFILGQSEENPAPYLLEDAKYLLESGCDGIYIPCNTAHHFVNQFDPEIKKHVIHMIDETVSEVKQRSHKRILLLATSGTVSTKLYQDAFQNVDIECEVLPDELQRELMSLIYDQIKAGKMAQSGALQKFVAFGEQKEVDAIILGCTELSLLKEQLQLPDFYIDAMECAIKTCIKKARKKVKE